VNHAIFLGAGDYLAGYELAASETRKVVTSAMPAGVQMLGACDLGRALAWRR
jgi:hypothetical protein